VLVAVLVNRGLMMADLHRSNNARTQMTITSQQHDLNAINIDAASVDRAIQSSLGLWDTYEMGISREEVQRQIDEANTPEARAGILADLRARAQKRADLAVIAGKVACMSVGETWHGLGVQVDEAVTAVDAMKLAALDYEVDRFPASVQIGEEWVEVPGVYCIGKKIQTEEGELTSIFSGVSVGSRHELLQNQECFEFIDEVVGSVNGAHYLTAGAIEGGKKTFITAQMPQWAEPVLGDIVHMNIVMTNAHDATESTQLFTCEDRPVCKNTRRLALRNAKQSYTFRHSKNMRQRIADARNALGLSALDFAAFAEVVTEMPKIKVDPARFIDDVLDNVPRYSQILKAEVEWGIERLVADMNLVSDEARDEAARRFGRMIARRASFKDDMMNRYESETNSAPGTLWGAYNAVTEHANHSLRYMGDLSKQRETRFSSLLNGRADVINQEAYTEASSYVLTA